MQTQSLFVIIISRPGGVGNYKPIPALNPIQVSQNYPIPVPYPINLSHTHPNRGGAGRVTRLTSEIAIPIFTLSITHFLL